MRWHRQSKLVLMFVVLAFATLSLFAWRVNRLSPSRAATVRQRRVIVIGIDGMDFRLTQSLIEQQRLPHLARLAARGSFVSVESSMPPLSPVAWSNFITGRNPGGHGVFDFLRRLPSEAGPGLVPRDAVTDIGDEGGEPWSIPFTSYVWPASETLSLQRAGNALWEVLEEKGIPSIVYKVPASYPVAEGASRVLSGMGTPDVEGTYGMFTLLSDRPEDAGRVITGGRLLHVAVVDGAVRLSGAAAPAAPYLRGPLNPFRSNRAPENERQPIVPFRVHVDPEEKSIVVTLQEQDVVLRQGEWSEWVSVSFELVPGIKSINGNVRFYLQEVGEHLRMYVSPVNVAPGSHGLASARFDQELYDALGPYYTKGMPEETKAYLQGLFTTGEYLEQSNQVRREGIDALDYILNQPGGGLRFVYFSTLDLGCHVLWKHSDPTHPAHDSRQSPPYATSLMQLYKQMDDVVGNVLQRLGPDEILYVMSDHGFAPMYRAFDPNAWLASEGYLTFKSGAKTDDAQPRENIDWSRTRAYGLGFQGLYVSLQGREGSGIVRSPDYVPLVEEIRGKLMAYRDPSGTFLRGRPVFHRIYRPEEIYSGPRTNEAPDLVLGYSIGYGPSDEAVVGASTGKIVADQLRGFSGHHATDVSLVPGVLFSNHKLAADKARLEDIAATILQDFDLPPAGGMTGKPLR